MDWYLLHGITMILSFAISGISVLLIYYKTRFLGLFTSNRSSMKVNWVDLHLQIHLIGYLLSVASLGIVYFAKNTETQPSSTDSNFIQALLHPHLQTPHSFLGLVCFFVTALVTPHYGLPAENDDVKRSIRIHSVLGRIAIISCYINIAIGLYDYLNIYNGLYAKELSIVFGLWTSVVLGCICYMEYRIRHPSKKSKKTK